MNTKIVTHTELVAFLKTIKGNTFFSFQALTKPQQRKTGNPYDEILKLSTINASTGFDYEANVQAQQVREGLPPDFQAQARKWGTKLSEVLIEHEGKFYIRCRVLKTLDDPIFFGRRGQKLIKVQKTEIEAWLSPARRASTQNTEKEIVYRDFLVQNIRSINILGDRLEVIS